MNKIILSTIIVFILTLTIALPVFANGNSVQDNSPVENVSSSTTLDAKQPSNTAVLFTNTTPYEIAVNASDYKQDFGRHPDWLDDKKQNPKSEDRHVIKPGMSAYLELSMLSHRKNYSFCYKVEFLGTNCWGSVRFDNTRIRLANFGSINSVQSTNSRFPNAVA